MSWFNVLNITGWLKNGTTETPVSDVDRFPVHSHDSTDVEYLKVATTVTSAGDTTLVTPSSGKSIRLHWVYAINDPTASTSTKITIKLGSAVQYVAWAISKRQQLTGAVNQPLVINLSNTGDVAVTIFYEEV